MDRENEVRVWDPFVRIFHWGLAGAFLLAFVVEDHNLAIHSWAGYTALALVALRLPWGLVGPRHARFSDFVRAPREAFAYAGRALIGRAERHLGHNPAGGLMIVALLAAVPLLALSGMAALAVEEGAGPMAGLLAGLGHRGGEWIGEVHEFLANATMALVGIHVAGVLVESLVHRENLVRSMITGRKRRLDASEREATEPASPDRPGPRVSH
ncbi:cytochrome b/b6 domain-containing protein [Burkholderiaceae bacterium FT117]|uniref:cytochrome b/b6 domain-containing protein n=1 Tax=Zeimonas sediminis TaxID=2944268 RepID=UPI0023430F14|nr:cytochrome b/b6 domain-containing protein [Zeimonas sediminis]MCM5570151.1 cytochrome b/b6 domain-containing protein [Zeimonas sediminis]